MAANTQAVVLVEGVSDQIAVEAAAGRLGHDLRTEGIAVVPMGGAQAIGRFLARFGPQGANLPVAGLYDVGEEGVIRRGLQRAGLGSGVPLTRADLEGLGFYVCILDLEDEWIRALGAAAVLAVVEAQGEIDSFRTLQKQPAWRGRPVEAQLRRFLTRSRRIRASVQHRPPRWHRRPFCSGSHRIAAVPAACPTAFRRFSAR